MNPSKSSPGVVEDVAALRPYLFSIAYRLVGSASEAEDLGVDGGLLQVSTFDVLDGQISAVRNILNPDKLAFLAGQLAARAAA